MRNAYSFLVRKPEDPGIYGKVILEWILGKYGRKLWTGSIWLSTGGLL
jgi:hypothetical protein